MKRRSLIPLDKVTLVVEDTFVVRRLYRAWNGRCLVRYDKMYHPVWMDNQGYYHLKDEKVGKK